MALLQPYAGSGPASFQQKKAHILSSLSVPKDQYTDSSPKGTVDEGIRQLIEKINKMAGCVTTSSCAGRISVFLEGRKKDKKDFDNTSFYPHRKEQGDNIVGEEIEIDAARDVLNESFGNIDDRNDRHQQQLRGSSSLIDAGNSSVGGKGNGGRWLFVSHDPLPLTDLNSLSPTQGFIKEHEDHPRSHLGRHQEEHRRSFIEILGMEHLESTATGQTAGQNLQNYQQINSLENLDRETSEESREQHKSAPIFWTDVPKLFCQPDLMSTLRLIRLKFEPMILHILTASLTHANRILIAAIQAGFRESGAVNLVEPRSPAKRLNLLQKQVERGSGVQVVNENQNAQKHISRDSERENITPMVAVRSSGMALESVVGIEWNGHHICIIPEWQIRGLLLQVNQRFEENTNRIKRFAELLTLDENQSMKKFEQKKANKIDPSLSPSREWEEANMRRIRKRNEGLARAKTKTDDVTHLKPMLAQDSESFISDLELLGSDW